MTKGIAPIVVRNDGGDFYFRRWPMHVQRFLNSELREMECAERLRFAPRRLLSRARRTLWGGWFECDVWSIAKTLHQEAQCVTRLTRLVVLRPWQADASLRRKWRVRR